MTIPVTPIKATMTTNTKLNHRNGIGDPNLYKIVPYDMVVMWPLEDPFGHLQFSQ